MPGHGDLKCRDEVRRGEGLDDVGHGAGGAGSFDELGLGEGGQHDDGAVVLLENPLRRGDAVGHRHLDVKNAQIGIMLISQADGLLTICGLRDDLVAGVGESLDDVKADEGLVLSDEHPAGLGGAGLIAHGCDPSMISLLAPPQSGRRASVAQLAEASDSKSECCGFESHRRYQQALTRTHPSRNRLGCGSRC